MKRILLLSIALFLGLCVQAQIGGGSWIPGTGFPRPGGWINIPVTGGGGTTPPPTPGGGSLQPGGPGTPPLPRTLTASVDVVQAWFDYDFGQVAISFANEVGVVNISITNAMGQVVASYCCDTDSQWEVMIQMPDAEGHYTLHIEGAQYSGFGEFDL